MAIRTDTRINEEISAKEVRLVDENGKQMGIVPYDDALARSRGKGLDLVEVAPDGDPPVCRIMDYSKFIFEMKRKQKLANKKKPKQDTKEIKLRPNIDKHDLDMKLKHARGFLEKGHKVKLTVRYRMREMRHYEIGTQRMDDMIEALADVSSLESTNRSQGRSRLQMATLNPKASPKSRAELEAAAAKLQAAAAKSEAKASKAAAEEEE